ncbi:MAG TPA: hypothetical protein VEK55_18250, partial [Xanthobacteraceae bacterium]|nr:hypothetical protein [Xanthobacteraceae bacterium]
MTFPFPMNPGEPIASTGPTGTPSDPSPEASRLTAPPQVGSRPAASTASPEAAASAQAPVRTPVAVPGPAADDFRIDPAAAAQAADRPAGLFRRAAALGVAACLGAAAGSAGLAAVNAFSSAPQTAQADSVDD